MEKQQAPTHLALAITAYQQKYDVDGKELAAALGVHASTITRLRQGFMPDTPTLLKLMGWMLREAPR